MKIKTSTPVGCETCLYMATHEECYTGGGCLNTPEDYAEYRNCGVMPPMRYRNWVESNPMEQIERQHRLQVEGKRQIVLGPGEAEVNTNQSPEEASKHLHYVAEECGYMGERLTPDAGDGKQSLTVFKDFGPFRIEWENSQLSRIMQGEKGEERRFWQRSAAW